MAAVAPEPTHATVHNIELVGQPHIQPENIISMSQNPAEQLQGTATTEGPAVSGDEVQEVLSPLTYIDFIPQCFGVRVEGSDPSYAEFQSLVEQANQWLQSMPGFCAVKCETVDQKLNPTDRSLSPDNCLQHISSHGKNVYVKILRLWLMPRADPGVPVQQLAYITILPDYDSGNVTNLMASVLPAAMRIHPEQLFPQFDSFSQMMDKLNRHLQQKPLPGRVLTAEIVPYKAMESDSVEEKLNTESTLWTESGKNCRLFVYAVRIFYAVGQPAFEKVGFHDQVPDFSQSPEGLAATKLKFAPFSQTVAQAAQWLQAQQNTKVVNIQTVTLKMDRQPGSGLYKVNTNTPGYMEAPTLMESRYVKIVRLFYAQDKKSEVPNLYASTRLTTRLFVPTKTQAWGRSFESFSKTMQRVIAWLTATGTPVLGMETVKYPVSPDNSEDAGVFNDRVDVVLNSSAGQFSLTCIRLYFTREFKEPPPEVVRQTDEDYWASWGCVLA